jgi:hypothetical protein
MIDRSAARQAPPGAGKIGREGLTRATGLRDAYSVGRGLDRCVILVQLTHQGRIALASCGQGWTGPLGPRSRRIDCMIANVVVLV